MKKNRKTRPSIEPISSKNFGQAKKIQYKSSKGFENENNDNENA